jgi:pimeloyl-ACP methyl ester carboxylesterase
MPRPGDVARAIELPGPWRHRYVAANGARFHVAETGPADGRLVLLLHGFPEFWWAWRHQLPALGDAGYRAAAMDLRGYGGSDKTPNGYDPVTLAQDVSGVIKALGARSAVLVGHSWGGYVGWATAVLHQREVSALAAVAAPHPAMMLDRLRLLRRSPRVDALRHVLAMQVPMLPERRLADPDRGFVRDHLAAWSVGGSFPTEADVTTYQAAMSLWPASHCALEYHRWLVRSRFRADGHAFDRQMAAPVGQPVLSLMGADDPALPLSALADSRRHVVGPVTERVLPGVGHFPHEEAPVAVTEVLLDWLSGL